MVGSGHARRGPRGDGQAGSAAKAKSGWRSSFPRCWSAEPPAHPSSRASAVEVMDISSSTTPHRTLTPRRRQTFISGDPGALLCVEFYADRPEDLPPRLQALEQHLSSNRLGYRYFHALDPAAQARIWSVREAGLGLSMAMKDDNKSLSFVEDTAVAPERLRDFIDRFLQIVRGTARRPACMPTRRSAACTSASGQPEDRSRREDV